MDNWLNILQLEIARDPRGKAGVAQRMGVSRAYLSRATSCGSSAYKTVPRQFIARVRDLADTLHCPVQNTPIPRAECHKACGPAPTHNPNAMSIWRECQRCPHKPPESQP
jgi:hypothetical protein